MKANFPPNRIFRNENAWTVEEHTLLKSVLQLPLTGAPLREGTALHVPGASPPQTYTSSSSRPQRQICLTTRPIAATAEINVWSDFCCGRQLVATYFYVSQGEGGAGLVSWGTLSGSDGEGLSGEKTRVSWLTPSTCGTGWPPAMLSPDLALWHQCQRGSEGPWSLCLPHICLQLLLWVHPKCLLLGRCH